jgi:hypothetical protein
LLSELNPFCKAGDVDLYSTDFLPFLTSWLNVGINFSPPEIFLNSKIFCGFNSALGYYISISKMCIKNT